MGLKEPAILVDFAAIHARRGGTAATRRALDVSLRLLARPLGGGEVQIVKPSNGANAIADVLFDERPDAKAIVLHSGLPAFLTSVLDGESTRAYGRRMLLDHLNAEDPNVPKPRVEDLLRLTDLQAAAWGWTLQARALAELAVRHGPARVRMLSRDRFLADKADVLGKVAGFFGLRAGAGVWVRAAAGPMFKEHAKRLGKAFDAVAQQERERRAQAETAPAAAWAIRQAAGLGWKLELGDTL